MEKLAIISCSGSKIPGGSILALPKSPLESILSAKAFAKLMMHRQDLANVLQEPSGPDLGNNDTNNRIDYLPVYNRYTGKVFSDSGLNHLGDPEIPNGIIVLSGLYGLLHIKDYIRFYNVSMTDELPSGIKVNTWWKRNGLGSIIHEYISAVEPNHIVDFLFSKYGYAATGWDENIEQSKITRFPIPRGFQAMSAVGLGLKNFIESRYPIIA